MASQSTRWTAPSLARHKPVLLALTVVALGYTVYYIREQFWSTPNPPTGSLHRSNARRQRSRSRPLRHLIADSLREHPRYVVDGPWGTVPVSLDFLTDTTANEETYGQHLFLPHTGPGLLTTLHRHRMPALEDISRQLTNPEEARELRRELEEGFLIFYLWRYLSPSPISEEQRITIIAALENDGGFSPEQIAVVLQQHQDGELTGSVERWLLVQEQRREADDEETPPLPQTSAADQAFLSRLAATASPPDSEHSWADRESEDDPEAGKEGQSLLNLLYRIAEEQARKDGYVHRRVTCNSCNITPIRGIRYRCANCYDYDLCEQCEAMQIHSKTHLFYKIRVPAPYLGTSRQPEPVWYPGKPTFVVQNLSKDALTRIAKETGYQVPEVEALWEQFRCLAAAEYPEDPSHYYQAIDRRTFDKCFVPNTSIRPSPPNLVYDRIFSFYDQNNDGLIGFEEFIKGLASLTRKNLDERLKRIFQGYDVNDDGYVDRKDFLRMFRAYYAANKELTRDIVAGMDDDNSDSTARDIVLGSQPISSAFSGAVPRGERSRNGEGKVTSRYGDYEIYDNRGTIENWDQDVAEPEETLADAAEKATFGNVHARSTDVYIDCSAIYSDPWPPALVSRVDVQKSLATHGITDVEGISSPIGLVTDPIEQKRIRRYAHERIATEYQKRQFIRRQAIRNRRRRQLFYLDGENDMDHLDVDDPRHGGMGTVTDEDILRWKNFRRISGTDQDKEMRAALADNVRNLEWPVESATELVDTMIRLFKLGWTGKAIADDFSGYGSGLADSTKFVMLVSERLEEAVKHFTPEAEKVEPLEPFPSTRRSRSSSKVRFQEDLETDEEHESRSVTSMSSRSIPVNERWGGFEVPEPEKEGGREVLYQVTQEAFNELLDPVFRLREDLALAVQRTVLERKWHRSQIISAVKDALNVKNHLDMYQRRWRRKARESSNNFGASIELDEATWYLQCLVQEEANVKDRLTAERCPRCAERGGESLVPIGEYCIARCGYLSSGRRDELTPKEQCSRCAENGKESYIGGGPGWIACTECGQLSTQAREEEARLSRIILGVQTTSSSNEQENQHDPITNDDHPDVDPAQQDTFPPPDPTLPQTRPNSNPPPDPTLPQNRPNSDPQEEFEKHWNDHLGSRFSDDDIDSDSSGQIEAVGKNKPMRQPNMQKYGMAGPYPGSARLKWWAALDLIEQEDKKRGGPGRLSFREFEGGDEGGEGAGLGVFGELD
ncbi:hypothetical protein ABVK25_011370 [Lepraria finkii]|uniref:Uncharacterized protein n=1 Tax=Lepraria finkii TaxID=1340010 RepID=A0ABR4APU5_9LECA